MLDGKCSIVGTYVASRTRKELASLPFAEKLKILAKLRERSLAIAAAGLRKSQPALDADNKGSARNKPK